MRDELPEFDLERFLPYRLAVVASRLSAGLAKHYRTQYGISIAEWRVLLNVGYSGEVSIRDIERRVSLEKSKVSRAASKLEAKGYLTKQTDATDRRLVKLALTATGAGILEQLIPIAQAYQSELETSLGAQTDLLQNALDRLMEGGEEREGAAH